MRVVKCGAELAPKDTPTIFGGPDGDLAREQDLADLERPESVHLPDLADCRLPDDVRQDFADADDAGGEVVRACQWAMGLHTSSQY